MPRNKLARYGLTHNPFPAMAPPQDGLRRAVFTSYEDHLDELIACLLSGRACCILGSYGMGKTFLMLESRARIQQSRSETIPIYERALTGQGFDLTALEGLFRHARDLILEDSSVAAQTLWKRSEADMESARNKKLDPMRVIRDLVGYFQDRHLTPALLIDDIDRIHGIERLKNVVDTSRELLSLGCSIALPGNPDNPTRIIRTVGQGIFDTVVLKPLSEGQFKLMVSRYLATSRSSVPKLGSWDDSGPQVFICYAEEDLVEAERLYGRIRSLGYRPWMTAKDLLPGENRGERIDKAINDSSFFLACISKTSVSKRGFVQSALKTALDRARELLEGDIYIIPILLDDSAIPSGIDMLQAADIRAKDFLSRLDASFRRGWELRSPTGTREKESELDLRPFEEDAVARIVAKIEGGITPRMLMKACSGLLNLAADEKIEAITSEFVEEKWAYVGRNILAKEASLDSLISILLEIAERNGVIDEEVDLKTIKRILQGASSRFSDLVKTVQGFEDIILVQEDEGLTKLSLSPLISPDLLKEDFSKMKVGEFRRRYGGGEEPESPFMVAVEKPML